jgi:hypothetical protein
MSRELGDCVAGVVDVEWRPNELYLSRIKCWASLPNAVKIALTPGEQTATTDLLADCRVVTNPAAPRLSVARLTR